MGVAAGAIRNGAGLAASLTWISRTWLADSGFPAFVRIACTRFANVGCRGGGAARTTIGRVCTTAGGLALMIAVDPNTACFVGTVAGAKARIGALRNALGSTRTRFLDTGWAVLNACDVVAATAPGTLRLM